MSICTCACVLKFYRYVGNCIYTFAPIIPTVVKRQLLDPLFQVERVCMVR